MTLKAVSAFDTAETAELFIVSIALAVVFAAMPICVEYLAGLFQNLISKSVILLVSVRLMKRWLM